MCAGHSYSSAATDCPEPSLATGLATGICQYSRTKKDYLSIIVEPGEGVCHKSENCSKNLVTIFFKNLFGKLVHIFREVSAYLRGVSAYFREVSAYFRSETSFQNFETSFENFGAIMATGGLQ